MPLVHPRMHKTVLGVLTPHTGGFYYGTVMNGILHAARQNHAIAIAFETSRLKLKREEDVLASGWVDGWLAINEFNDPELMTELRARGQLIVHLHAKPDVKTGASVLPDNAGGMRHVTQHLIEHGHRSVAFAGNLGHVDVGERFAGYREALQDAGLSVSDDLVFDTLHHKEEDGRLVAEQLLRRRAQYLSGGSLQPVTALVAATDRLALGAMSSYLEAGLCLPQDLAVVGFDDVDAAQFSEPPLTTVKQSFFDVAVRAVMELLGAIRGESELSPTIRVATQPMVRRSCGCVVSHSIPPQVEESDASRRHELTRLLLIQAGRNRVTQVHQADWPDVDKLAVAIDAAARGVPQPEPVQGQWWSGFLRHNRDAESTVRVMELLESTLRTWDPARINHHYTWGVLRDLRVALMHEWQRTERVMVAHYESVTEAAYRLANSLSNSGADPSHDLSWIRWSNPQRACCSLWSELLQSTRPASPVEPRSRPPERSAPVLRLTGEYTSELGAVPTNPATPPLTPAQFPPHAILEAAGEQGSMVTIASIPRARDGEYGLLAVVAPLTFEHLEFVGTPGDWAAQLGAALDRAAAERELRASAELDALTGLANRSTLLERVEALRTSVSLPGFALLFIDLDDFKKVNDSLGHLAGDQLLVQIAERLTSEVRLITSTYADKTNSKLVARLGGDEFVVVLSGVESEQDAVLVVERLQARLRQPFSLNGSTIFVSASIGVILGRGGESGALELLRDADTAMYRAKVKGRARHEIFHHGMHKQALERLHLDSRLRLALEHNELELWYQPIMDLTTGGDVGAEALIRWRHPEQGLLMPARFLAVAEDVGLAIPFSEWVIRRACSEVARFRQPGGRALYVNVNVPAAHIKHPGFVQFIEGALEKHGLSAQALGIEIVESTLLDEPEHCTATLSKLLALGVRIAIDDFGTGYSSLSYLRDFPASTLKIDRSFVMNVPGSSRDNGITRAIIAMGQGLGLSLVAEGIETQEQLQFLIQAGCDFAQGYLISPPLPFDEYVERLARFRPSEPPRQRTVRLAVR